MDEAAAPVHDTGDRPPEEGIAIALSGGGYRAMLFHAGTLWRLFQTGHLQAAQRISSVSGGSIAAGVLALAWPSLRWGDGGASYQAHVVAPIRRLASRSIDIPSILLGLAVNNRAGWWIERAYRRHLFGRATLQDLPDSPRFVINAANLHNGVLWRFSKPFMGDWKTGRVADPTVALAKAVAASSAFPPFLSPVDLSIRGLPLIPEDGQEGARIGQGKVMLTDGGVYDNLGLETVWKRYRTLLVSDGGGQLGEQASPSRLWSLQAYRVLAIIQNQVGALRVRQLIDFYRTAPDAPDHRKGAHIGIAAQLATSPRGLPCDPERARALALTPTALRRLDPVHQERLINWGYAICDARLRAFVDPALPPAPGFPYPASGV